MPVAAPIIGAVGSVAGAALSKPKKSKDPNAYLQPYLSGAAGDAQNLYNQGGPQVYGGPTVAGMGDTTQQVNQAILQRAQNGNPLVSQAQNYVSQGLNSPISSQFGASQNPYAQQVDSGSASNPYATGANPFGGATNPYLDQTFQHAAQQGQQQLDSAYARGGRNLGAGAPASADMLSSLASQIYAPAYENERNRQLSYGQQQNQLGSTSFDNAQNRQLQSGLNAQNIGAQGYENSQNRALSDLTSQRGMQQNLLGYASPLAAQDYMDLSAAQGVGAQQDAQSQAMLSDKVNTFNQQQQAPYANLQNYLSSLTGLAGKAGQVQQPMQQPNYLTAGLGGALLGQQLYQQPAPYQPSPSTPPYVPPWGSSQLGGLFGPVGFGGG